MAVGLAGLARGRSVGTLSTSNYPPIYNPGLLEVENTRDFSTDAPFKTVWYVPLFVGFSQQTNSRNPWTRQPARSTHGS